MTALETSSQDLLEIILNLLTPCEGIVKFRHTILVNKNVSCDSCGMAYI